MPGGGTFGEKKEWQMVFHEWPEVRFRLSFGVWLRLDLPYVLVWPGLSRFKRLSRCPFPVSKMSRNFTSAKFSKLTPGGGAAFSKLTPLWEGAALFDSPRDDTSPCRGPDLDTTTMGVARGGTWAMVMMVTNIYSFRNVSPILPIFPKRSYYGWVNMMTSSKRKQ